MKQIVLCVLCMLLLGCGAVLKHSEQELADNTKTLQIARNRISVVKSQICFAKGLGMTEGLPVREVARMDKFLEMTADPNSMTDCELVYSLGVGVKFYEACIKAAIPELSRVRILP